MSRIAPDDIGTLPPPERGGHDAIRVERRAVTDDSGKVTGTTHGARVLSRTTLERLWRRGRITKAQFDAGNRLYSAYYRGGFAAPMTLSLTRVHVRSSGDRDLSERQMEARAEYNAAMAALPAELTDLTYDAICADKTLETICFERRWRNTTAVVRALRPALDGLDRHFNEAARGAA